MLNGTSQRFAATVSFVIFVCSIGTYFLVSQHYDSVQVPHHTNPLSAETARDARENPLKFPSELNQSKEGTISKSQISPQELAQGRAVISDLQASWKLIEKKNGELLSDTSYEGGRVVVFRLTPPTSEQIGRLSQAAGELLAGVKAAKVDDRNIRESVTRSLRKLTAFEKKYRYLYFTVPHDTSKSAILMEIDSDLDVLPIGSSGSLNLTNLAPRTDSRYGSEKSWGINRYNHFVDIPKLE